MLMLIAWQVWLVIGCHYWFLLVGLQNNRVNATINAIKIFNRD